MQLQTMKRVPVPKGSTAFKYLAWPWLKLISLLPFWMLYGISNGMRFLLYHVFGYRVKVVRDNLKNSFPELSDSDRKTIEKKYYSHLSDLFVETIKGMSISEKQMRERMSNIDQHEFDNLHK